MVARLVAGADGRYLDVNDEALEILGASRDDVLARGVGDYAGPYRDLARTVWARLATTGATIPIGEASLHRPDGTAVRVRYTRIAQRADGAYELEFETLGPGEGPPRVDKPSLVLEEWRAADRDRESGALDGEGEVVSDALRTLYQHGVRGRDPR